MNHSQWLKDVTTKIQMLLVSEMQKLSVADQKYLAENVVFFPPHLKAENKSVQVLASPPSSSSQQQTENKVPQLRIICVDGCQNPATGDNAWASVTDEKSNDLIVSHKYLFTDLNLQEVTTPKGRYIVIVTHFNDVKSMQNNGAEMVAMLAGLRIALSGACESCKIQSDSQLMVDSWSLGRITAKTASKMDPNKMKLLQECIVLRKKFDSLKNCGVLKISGSSNPADLGYHV